MIFDVKVLIPMWWGGFSESEGRNYAINRVLS